MFGELDAAYLESNYDPEMLANGSYSPQLQARIRGGRGHLSNEDAALLNVGHRSHRLKWVALAHLSEENNHPDLAMSTHRRLVGKSFPVRLASRYGPSEWFEV